MAQTKQNPIAKLDQVEVSASESTEEAYKRLEREAVALLDKGFHLGGVIRSSRNGWHERQG